MVHVDSPKISFLMFHRFCWNHCVVMFLGPQSLSHAATGVLVIKNDGVNCGFRHFHGGPALSMNHALVSWFCFATGSPVPLVNTVVPQTVAAIFPENAPHNKKRESPLIRVMLRQYLGKSKLQLLVFLGDTMSIHTLRPVFLCYNRR